MAFDPNFTAEEIELLRYVLKRVRYGKLASDAMKHPAWETLLRKCGFDEHMPTRDPQDLEDRRPKDLPNGGELLRQRFADEGYNEKEIAVILHQLKEPSKT